jgi:hypothetical protein
MKMRHFALAATAIAMTALTQQPAHAFVVNLYDFDVTKNGNPYMTDSFGDAAGLAVAGTMTEPPNSGAPNFFGIYGSSSFAGQSEAGNGFRVLDTSAAPIIPSSFISPPGGPSFVKSTQATLVGNLNPLPNSTGLKKNAVIHVQAMFDLIALTAPFDQYGISLQDNTSFGVGNDSVTVTVGTNSSGIEGIRIQQRDFTTGTITPLVSIPLTPADLLNSQIVLMLDNSASDLTHFTGSYALVNDGVFDTETVNAIGAASVALFHGEDWTGPGFFATAAAPEPATMAIFGAALGGLAFLRRRKAA